MASSIGRWKTIGCGLVVFCAALLAVGEAPAGAESIVIGGIFDLSSGAGSVWGHAEQNGFSLAIADFEAENPGWTVGRRVEDSAYSNMRAVSALQKLAAVDGVRLLVGPTWEVFAAIMPVCEARHIVCIAPSYNSKAFDDVKLRYSFTAWFDEREYSRVHAEDVVRRGYRRLAVFGGISPYYDSLVEAFLAHPGVKPFAVERVPEGVRDFRSLIAKLPAGIDALAVFLLADGTAQSFFKQWAELRPDRPDILTDDAVLYFDPPFDLPGAGFHVSYSVPDLNSDRLAPFEKRYAERFGQPPGAPSAAVAYDSTRILLQCARENSSAPERVRDCVAAVSGYAGVSGTLTFGGSRGVKERKMVVMELQKK